MRSDRSGSTVYYPGTIAQNLGSCTCIFLPMNCPLLRVNLSDMALLSSVKPRVSRNFGAGTEAVEVDQDEAPCLPPMKPTGTSKSRSATKVRSNEPRPSI